MFRRPAWATTSSHRVDGESEANAGTPDASLLEALVETDDDQAVERRSTQAIFRHAAQSHDAIIAESVARRRKEGPPEERGKRRAKELLSSRSRRMSSGNGESRAEWEENERARINAEQDSSPEKGVQSQQKSGPGSSRLKKRRINAQDSNALLSELGLGNSLGRTEDEQMSPIETDAVDDGGGGGGGDGDGDGGDRDAEDDDVQIQYVRPLGGQDTIQVSGEDSDPELVELQRKARERHRAAEQAASTASMNTTSLVKQAPRVEEGQDPAVQLLITSPIPNTNPLIVYRRLSQRLQEVRVTYCHRQGFAEEFTAKVFLTFCGRRKYDATAVKSLGLTVDALGIVKMKKGALWEEVDQLHLVATTEELLAKLAEESGKKGEEDVDGAAGDEQETVERQQIIRLLIRAKGQKDFKLKVKPTTQISKIVHAARQEFQVADSRTAYLEFDGEQLDADDEIRNTEIEDMNCLDFYSS